MKFPFISREHWKALVSLTIIAILLASLLVWTASAPAILSPQTESDLSSTLFQYTKIRNVLNVTDGEGTYSFLFGLDYNGTVSPGIPSIVEVYISLLSEQKSSGFLKGVSLEIMSSRVLIDSQEDSGAKSVVSNSGDIFTDRLSGVDINETGGTHQLSIRLIVSTVDVNYIGYLGGSEEAITLNGTLTIA